MVCPRFGDVSLFWRSVRSNPIDGALENFRVTGLLGLQNYISLIKKLQTPLSCVTMSYLVIPRSSFRFKYR